MATMLEDLLRLHSIEKELAQVRRRLRTRNNAVAAQQGRIAQLRADWQALHDKSLQRKQHSDQLELDLKVREQEVTKLRGALNTAKTNKEYAAILTQINTIKADNAKTEEETYNILQDIDTIKAQADEVGAKLAEAEGHLEEVQQSSSEEITRLDSMLADLVSKRSEATKDVPPKALAVFERIASNYEGDAMAPIETQGDKPPLDFVCGGCFMGLNAEHANALAVRDEIRTCDNCGRILYLEHKTENSQAH